MFDAIVKYVSQYDILPNERLLLAQDMLNIANEDIEYWMDQPLSKLRDVVYSILSQS